MKFSSTHRQIAILLLCALLVTPWVAAAEPRSEPAARSAALAPHSLLTRLWERLTALWSEEGADIDPYGGHQTIGSDIDPDGGDQDIGPEIDPYG